MDTEETSRGMDPLLLGSLVVAWLVGVLLTVAQAGPRIEDALAADVRDALRDAGLPQIQTEVEQRDVVLTGSVAAAADAQRAIAIAAMLEGPRSVTGRLEVRGVVEPDPEPVVPLLELEEVAVRDDVQNLLSGITFGRGSARLDAAARGRLDALLILLAEHPRVRGTIDGPSPVPGEAAAAELSEWRARAVVNYLVGRGMAPDRLEARGYAEPSAHGAAVEEAMRESSGAEADPSPGAARPPAPAARGLGFLPSTPAPESTGAAE